MGRPARPWSQCLIPHWESREEVRTPFTFSKVPLTQTFPVHEFGNKWILLCANSSVFRALLNAIKNQSHLMEVDALLVRSCLYLMPFDGLMECVINSNTELLDILHVFTNKVPQDITHSNFQVKWKQNNKITWFGVIVCLSKLMYGLGFLFYRQ